MAMSSFSQWNWQNPDPTGNTIKSVDFASATTGYAAGDNGTILKTTDGGFGLGIENKQKTSRLNGILQIYPKSAKETITIESSSTENSTIGIISVYKMTGQEFFRQQTKGSKTELNVCAFSPGIYFIRSVNNKTTECGKFVKE